MHGCVQWHACSHTHTNIHKNIYTHTIWDYEVLCICTVRVAFRLIKIWNKERGGGSVRVCTCVCLLHTYVSVFNVEGIWLRVKIWREKTVTFVNTHLPSACTPAQCMHSCPMHALALAFAHKHGQTHMLIPLPLSVTQEDIDITTVQLLFKRSWSVNFLYLSGEGGMRNIARLDIKV